MFASYDLERTHMKIQKEQLNLSPPLQTRIKSKPPKYSAKADESPSPRILSLVASHILILMAIRDRHLLLQSASFAASCRPSVRRCRVYTV